MLLYPARPVANNWKGPLKVLTAKSLGHTSSTRREASRPGVEING